MSNPCQQLAELYAALQDFRVTFREEYDLVIHGQRDIASAKKRLKELTDQMNEIRNRVDYDIVLRDTLGKQLGAVYVGEFHDGVALVAKVTGSDKGKMFFVDKMGKPLNNESYDDAHPFSCGLAVVKPTFGSNGYFIKTNGERLNNQEYKYLDDFSDDKAAVNDGGKAFYLNREGFPISEAKYAHCSPFSEKVGLVAQGTNPQFEFIDWSFVNESEERLFNTTFYRAQPFSDGAAAVELTQDTGFYYIDHDGKRLHDGQYAKCRPYHEGLAAVQPVANGKWHFINKRGEKIHDEEYAEVHDYHEGYASVRPDEGAPAYYIDRDGHRVHTGSYLYARDFCDGLAIVASLETRRMYIIDSTGQRVSPREFYTCNDFDGERGVFLVYDENDEDHNTAYVIDRYGNTVFSGKRNSQP